MPSMYESRKRIKNLPISCFLLFFFLLSSSWSICKCCKRKVLCMQFSVFDFYSLIWCLLTPIERKYTCHDEGVGKAMEVKQQQKARLNAHKTALHDDRFFFFLLLCNRTLQYALNVRRERERKLFMYTKQHFQLPKA